MNTGMACLWPQWRRILQGSLFRANSAHKQWAAAISTTPVQRTIIRHISDATKYNLRKLSDIETKAIENKIQDYGKQTKQSANDLSPADTKPATTIASSSSSSSSSESDSVTLTDSAIERLKYLSEKRQKTQYLRLRVDSGGCYGFSYMLDMTEEPEVNDVILDRSGAKMVIDDCSLPLVRGATIDWQDRLIGQAFLVVANPQASGGCGCGASFEIKLD
ncbi:[4Fe-4S] proteins maturation [Kickxella alabastrina]|uniref:[4Fe-4S] proteins maturation n=1 Tax=Kickxella alabastrina TaxID=61397 RepID=A0ACC1ICZ4_9FUNG|nr:[4Fe-4S] proteins maturation [Kickxella alabastrina]